MHIHGAALSADGRKVITDFGEYALADGEMVVTQSDLRTILAKQYRRWDEDNWARGGWKGTTREEFEEMASANEVRLLAAHLRPDAAPHTLTGRGAGDER